MRRAGFGQILGVSGVLRSEDVAWCPAMGAEELLAERLGVVGPVVVARVRRDQGSPINSLSAISQWKELEGYTHFLGAARPMIALDVCYLTDVVDSRWERCDKRKRLEILAGTTGGIFCPGSPPAAVRSSTQTRSFQIPESIHFW
jgi:hypothetical protein